MTDSTFDRARTDDCTLTVRLSPDTFTYLIHHPDMPETIVRYAVEPTVRHTSLMANVKEKVLAHAYLQHAYRQVRFLFAQPLCTTVPLEWFEDELADGLYHHCFPRENNRLVHYSLLPACNLAVLYAVDKAVFQLLKDSRPEASVAATVVPMMHYLHRRSLSVPHRQLCAYLHGKRMEVYMFHEGHLGYFNTFQGLQPADVSYYLLYIWQQLGLDQQQDACHLVADAALPGQLADTLRTYVRHVEVLPPLLPNKDIAFDLQTSLNTDYTYESHQRNL